MSRRLTILVSAMLAEVPGQGGWAWALLQYLLGLERLGHHVVFLEPISEQAAQSVDGSLARSAQAAYFRSVLEKFGLADRASLMSCDTREAIGLQYQAVLELAHRADVLLNISGRWRHMEIMDRVPIRVYVDLDPAFTQLWQVSHGVDMHLGGHTHYVTVGRAIGQAGCTIPTCGVEWIATNQPIVLEHWPPARELTYNGLTTIANWRGYGSAEYEGVFYGQKAHSLRQFIDLPRRCPENFMLALAIHPDETQDLAALRDNNWQLLDPAVVAATPSTYQQFVQGSKAEFGIAKSGYVISQCGWFSDRSVCYLASGRPVIAQETGFSRFLPTGEGLFAFQSADDVIAAVEAMNQDYARHSQAARRIAEEHFDSDIVLNTLLKRFGAV